MTSINKNVYTLTNYPAATPNAPDTEMAQTGVAVTSTASNIPTPTVVSVFTPVAPNTQNTSASQSAKKALKEAKKEAKNEMKRLEKEMNRCEKELHRLNNAYSQKAYSLLLLRQYYGAAHPLVKNGVTELLELEKKKNAAADKYYDAEKKYEEAKARYEEACLAYENYEDGVSEPSSTIPVPTSTMITVTTPPTSIPSIAYPTCS